MILDPLLSLDGQEVVGATSDMMKKKLLMRHNQEKYMTW